MEEEENIYEVEEVLNHKILKGIDFFLIHWKGFDKKVDYTWEPLENLSNCSELVFAYFSKKKKKIPNNVLEILSDIPASDTDNNNSLDIVHQYSSYSELEKSQSDSDFQPETKRIITQKELKNNTDSIIIKDNSNNNAKKLIKNNDEIKTDDSTIQPDELPHDHFSKSEFVENNSITDTITENNSPSLEEQSCFDTTEVIEVQDDLSETPKPCQYHNLWDEYNYLFKIQEILPAEKIESRFKHTREIELNVVRIVGKRKLNNENEYLVEWEDAVDRYSWVKESKLNCDEEVRKFEQKASKLPPKKPISYFLKKYEASLPSSSESVRAHENLIKLKEELLGT